MAEKVKEVQQAQQQGKQEASQQEMLVPLNTYLAAGIHIGMRFRVKYMKKFIYKIRPNRICVFDVQKIDERLRIAARFLARYKPEDILVVGRKPNSHKPVVKFAEATGAKAIYGRFMPGALTNPYQEVYLEPKIVMITDPIADRQALEEAVKSNIPVVALCDSFNHPANIDLVIPCNNKGRRALALIYWILAREYLKERGVIKGDAEFKYSVDDFIMPAEQQQK